MFGQNEVMKPRHTATTFLVKEIFPTIQGEGPFAGQPALFLRLGGCNLRCTFCDTDFTTDLTEHTVETLVTAIGFMKSSIKTDLLVITGGEPMLQNLPLLIKTIWDSLGSIRRIQIETAGTVWPKGLEKVMRSPSLVGRVYIVVSPKTTMVNDAIRAHADAWKYIINAGNASPDDGLPMYSTQPVGRANIDLARPRNTLAPIYVQPMDELDKGKNINNTRACIDIAMRFGYRISLQTHKILGVE